ncbi:hypothetical protein J3R82DRAFT_10628 [Butyriboletus roseoflavus]|nr:hypothetical protein J3R82DRAFT_10628 [Butyriboletus roseoflavus]
MSSTTTPSLRHVVQDVVSSIDEDSLEEGIDKLRALFPDTTLLAALDLVDRESVLKYLDAVGEIPLRSPWVHRDVQRLPPSGLVTAHVLLLHLPCIRIRGPDE